MTRYRFRTPPAWPAPPSQSWRPDPGWLPGTTWPPPPDGWRFWEPVTDDETGAAEPLWQYRPRGIDGRRHAVVSLVFAVLNVALLLTATIWTVTTSAVGHPLLGSEEFLILFVPMFPIFGWALWTLRELSRPRVTSRNRRPTLAIRDATSAMTRTGWALVGAGVVAGFIMLLASVASGTLHPPSGQPSYNSSLRRYELNNHGSVTVISRAAYDHNAVAGAHLFTLIASVFLIIALPVHVGQVCRQRRTAAFRNT